MAQDFKIGRRQQEKEALEHLRSSVHGMLIKMMYTENKSINQADCIASRLKTAPHSAMDLENNVVNWQLAP